MIVTVNVHARGAQLEHMLTNSEPKLIVVEPDNVERVLEASAGLAATPRVVVLGDGDVDVDVAPSDRVIAAAELFDQPPHHDHADVESSDLAQILYTSGTTGPSKGVMITHHQAYAFADYVAQAMEMTDDDIYYTCLPLFHVNAQLSVLAAVLTGGCLALYERFSASAFWGQVRDVGRHGGEPVRRDGVHPLPSNRRRTTSPTSLRVCWAFPAPYDILDDFERRYGFRVLTAYASTEANFVAIGGLHDRPAAGAAGRVHPRFEVKIVDADDQAVPPGVTGEIVTRPRDPFTMMLGYYRHARDHRGVFQNLWYHTGDAGRLDEHGYLYFVDRIKDVIRRRGENISSYEVEQAITSHPAVAECAAVAVRSELSEDEVMVVIVPRDGRDRRAGRDRGLVHRTHGVLHGAALHPGRARAAQDTHRQGGEVSAPLRRCSRRRVGRAGRGALSPDRPSLSVSLDWAGCPSSFRCGRVHGSLPSGHAQQ